MVRYRASGQCRSPVHLLNLQGQVLEADRVVPVHRALALEKIRSRSRRRQQPVIAIVLISPLQPSDLTIAHAGSLGLLATR
jgi:hypothetical protein